MVTLKQHLIRRYSSNPYPPDSEITTEPESPAVRSLTSGCGKAKSTFVDPSLAFSDEGVALCLVHLERVRDIGIFSVQLVVKDLWPGGYVSETAHKHHDDSPESKAILAYPSQYLTAESSSMSS